MVKPSVCQRTSNILGRLFGMDVIDTDAMTATIEEIPYAVLHKITAEVEGINRVLYDLTPKPVGTIEWE